MEPTHDFNVPAIIDLYASIHVVVHVQVFIALFYAEGQIRNRVLLGEAAGRMYKTTLCLQTHVRPQIFCGDKLK